MSDTTQPQPENAIIVSVRRGKPGLTRKVSTAHIEIGGVSYSVAELETKRAELGAERLQALIDGKEISSDPLEIAASKRTDKSFLKASKYILSTDSLKGIDRVDGKIRDLLDAICFRNSILREGTYYVAPRSVEELDARLQALITERNEEVEAFLSLYPALIERMPEKLGVLFDPSEYDSADELRKKFTVQVQYTTMDAPGSLSKISTEIFERERQRARQQYAELLGDIELQLLEGAAQWIDFLIAKLTDHEDGKPKVIRASSEKQIKDFFCLLSDRNATDHPGLAAIGERGAKIVSSIDLEALKVNPYRRESLRDKMTQLKDSLAPHIVNRPIRKMILSDSEEDAD